MFLLRNKYENIKKDDDANASKYKQTYADYEEVTENIDAFASKEEESIKKEPPYSEQLFYSNYLNFLSDVKYNSKIQKLFNM